MQAAAAQSAQTTFYDYDYISDVSSTRLDYHSFYNQSSAIFSAANRLNNNNNNNNTTTTQQQTPQTSNPTEFDAHKCRRQRQQKKTSPSSSSTSNTHQRNHSQHSYHHTPLTTYQDQQPIYYDINPNQTPSRNSRSLHHSPYSVGHQSGTSTTHVSNMRPNSVGSKPGGSERLKYVTFSNDFLNSSQTDAYKIINFQNEILNKFQNDAFNESLQQQQEQQEQQQTEVVEQNQHQQMSESVRAAPVENIHDYFYATSPEYLIPRT